MKKLFVSLAAALILSACASTNSVGDMAMGDDAALSNAGRNREAAQVSRSQLEQSRRQRANTSEELALEQQKRQNKHGGIRDTMDTASRGMGVVNEAIGTIRNLRWGFR
ncbi:NGK_0946 family protein [Neisseria sp.]|uniref:NGK_0946 family protein n=1 Tax=Neisseria sp. TaxID=192066 RepID=UPI0026DAD5FC|nr:hypothetical protein [Neisseria sp.]MDO4906376.1 hypothetical protein [Neisseria sp.]